MSKLTLICHGCKQPFQLWPSEAKRGIVFCSRKCKPNETKADLLGKVFGNWTVIAAADSTSKGYPRWRCKCACGFERVALAQTLLNGQSTSCGCQRRRCLSGPIVRHGKSQTIEYRIWSKILNRCINPNDRAYSNYGGRGIAICERWRLSFDAFLSDMGPRPSPKHSIDRIDNDGSYEPGNCRWATNKQQSRNKRTNVRWTFNGDTKTIVEWAESIGVRATSLNARVRAGWSVERALTTPGLRPLIRKGQTWRFNNDARNDARELRIVEVTDSHVRAVFYSPASELHSTRTIPRKLFGPYRERDGQSRKPNYRLLREAPAEAGAA